MTLSRLPNELLETIISHTLPEGFEGLSLTCKRIYALCEPYFQHHNVLRARFLDFTYYENTNEWIKTIRTAFDVITRIAIEPIVARYIQYADFSKDSFFTRGRPRELLADLDSGGAVLRLFANSPYLKQAGIDWQEFYNTIEEDLEAIRYSQNAAAFLLTLLPNVKDLELPRRWRPNDATQKLVDTIVDRAQQSDSTQMTPSLAQVTKFGLSSSLTPQDRVNLNFASPFLSLPRVRYFRGPSCIVMEDDSHKHTEINNSRNCPGKSLVVTVLAASCLNEVAIANFLQNTTRLKTLLYAHMIKTNSSSSEWDICKFIAAVGRKVGPHLEELSISISDTRGMIAPGKASLRHFLSLRKLQLPLEVAIPITRIAESNSSGGIASTSEDGTHESKDDESLLTMLIPPSVSQLSLVADGRSEHAKALDVLFQDLATWKKTTSSVLEEIQLSCPSTADITYKEQCAKLLVETNKLGVVLLLKPYVSTYNIEWSV